MIWLDTKYASLLGSQLEQFKVIKTRPYSARFRCPICGDSKQNKFKTRGYFYEYKGSLNVKCFNCGNSSSIGNFIKSVNPSLFDEYRIECLREKGNGAGEQEKFESKIEQFASRRIDHYEPFKQLKKISQLKPNHPAKQYVLNRNLPSSTHWRIYYSPTYYHWVNQIIPDKFSEKALAHDCPRLVFPFIDRNGYVFGFTGRAIGNSSVRYSTIITDDNKVKVFGLDQIDFNKQVYVVEGPIDSLFLDNCCAMAGSDIELNLIADQSRLVVVYDNEPRNKDIVNKINKAINKGYKVCIWPNQIEYKDINDMINAGLSAAHVQHIIDENTFEGLAAKMRMQQWQKVT